MCGIAGLVGAPPDAAAGVMARMLDRIAHRGPDDRRTFAAAGVTLGVVRLSTIDLSPAGGQPIANEDGAVVAVVNGEIYNYRELREELREAGHGFRGESDAEVVPHLYEEHGDDFAGRLHGMFAIGVWDVRRSRLVLVRDRVGKKPLFVADLPGRGVAFASEMKALFETPGVDLAVRPEAVFDFLTHGVVPGPRTVYRGIRRVPPAHRVVYERGRPAREERWWRIRCLPKLRIGREEAREEILRRLRRAVRLRLRSDVPVGCFLSGGIDSGLVAALASEQTGAPMRTFSVGFDDERFDERALASRVAARVGADHAELLLNPPSAERIARDFAHHDEPFFDPAVLTTSAAAGAAAADGLKVVLTGDGGDDLFGGYPYVPAAVLIARLRSLGLDRARPVARAALAALPLSARDRSLYLFAHRFLRVAAEPPERRYLGLTNDLLTPREARRLWPGARELAEGGWTGGAGGGLGAMDELLVGELRRRLVDQHLVRLDMATMAHGVEARSPLLDQDLVEFVGRMPARLRYAGGRTKPLLRGLAGRRLPAAVARGAKRGFGVPLASWIRGDLAGFVRERLLDAGGYAWNRFDRGRLEALIDGRGLDTRDRWRWAKVVWALVCLEIWWARFRTLRAAGGRPRPS